MPKAHTETRKKAKTDSSAMRKNPAPDEVSHAAILASMKEKWGCLRELASQYDQDKRKLIAEAVATGFALQDAPQKRWKEFMSEELWKKNPKARPKLTDQPMAPKFVARWYQGDHPRATKRASEIWIAVQQLLHEGVSAEDVPKELIRGRSIRTLCDLAAERRKTAKPRKPAKAPPTKKASGSGKAAAAPKAELKSAPAKSAKAAPAAKSKKQAADKQVRVKLHAVFPKGTGGFLALPKGTLVKAEFEITEFGKEPTLIIKKWKKVSGK